MLVTWFTYCANGKATWFTMTAFRTGNNNEFSGTLYRTTGPPLTGEPFDRGEVDYIRVGTATLSFSDADRGTFAYTINDTPRVRSITRFAFGPLPTCAFAGLDDPRRANTFEGNWWTAGGAESGWGLYLAHQGEIIFVGWFTYDADGTPTWFSATTKRIADGVYRGDVIQSTGPSFDTVPFDSQGVRRSTIGTMTLAFFNASHVSFEYSVRIGNPPSSISRTKLLELLIFRPPGTRCDQ
jgi:hypothetical protein